MSDVTERRVRPIQELLAAGNYKQALKDCEKWQKKGENSDRFLTLKAAVLLHQTDAKSKEKGKAEVQHLCQKTPAIVNVEAIYQLQDSLRQLSLGREEGPKVWERAIAARPGDKDLLQTWLRESISESNWMSAQKATMALRKASPQDRQHEYWNILMCFFIHQDSSLPQKDRTLFGTLASRMITKAAQTTDASKGISNPEELSVLGSVSLQTGSSKELVELLQNENLKQVVDQDPLLADTLLLQALDVCEDQNQILAFCEKRIFDADASHELSTDDRVWRLVSKSAQSEHAQKDMLARLEALITAHPQHRQAILTKIDLLLASSKDAASPSVELVNACKEYFELHGHKAHCFNDLITRVGQADEHAAIALYEALTSSNVNKSSKTELFLLKLQYHILMQQDLVKDKIIDLAARALDLHNTATPDDVAGTEAAYIAASTLLAYAAQEEEVEIVFQAQTILQSAFAKAKDYYAINVLLSQVQMCLGQVHIGMKSFFHLSVKNLQWETIGYLLLTRISTLHPFQHGHGDDSLNPLGALDTAMNVFEKADGSLDRATNDGLKMGSYSNVTDTFALRRKLHRSLVRQLFSIEERKCQRVWDIPVGTPLRLTKDDLVDLRDYSFMPSYGVDQSRLLDLLRCGPSPQREWINAMTLADHVVTYMQLYLDGQDEKAQPVLELLSKVAECPDSAMSELTEAEKDSHKVYQALAELLLLANGRVTSQSALGQPLEDVFSWFKLRELGNEPTTINGVVIPSGRFLHTSFVQLQTLQHLNIFTAVINKKLKAAPKSAENSKDLKGSVTEIRQLVTQRAEAIHNEARKYKQELNTEGVLGKLVDAALGRAVDGMSSPLGERLQLLQDETVIESSCGATRESWEDALDGVLRIRIKST